MPKKPVSDPITGQEMAFAHLVLSGTMNDRRAAETVGLNPDTAAYTKAKPRVRAYMIEHRAAVQEKLVDQEADGLRTLNLGRDQILKRLWELANLSPEVTRGIIAGQIKAMSMIVAIEGLIPDRRLSPAQTQSAAPPLKAEIFKAEWLEEQRGAEGRQADDKGPADPVTAAEPFAQPAAQPTPEPPPQPAQDASFPVNPFVQPERMSRVPGAAGYTFDTVLNAAGPLRLPNSSQRNPFIRGR